MSGGTIPQKYQVDHLFLLVGGNPLPNAVAGELLVAPNGRITLIHSKDVMEIAQRLKTHLEKRLAKRGLTGVDLKEIKESDPDSITQGVQECLQFVNANRVGLNYTGGTKVMSVHAYRAIEQWARERGIEAVFSYLDAQKLEMVFNRVGSVKEQERIYVERALQLRLEDLVTLHGWKLEGRPTQTPLLPMTASALAKVCANSQGWDAWKTTWKEKLKSSVSLQSPSSLQSLSQDLGFPGSLIPVIQSLDKELKANCFGGDLKQFHEWVDGKWLEDYVLYCLKGLEGSLDLHEHAMGISVSGKVEFEIDVMAMRGYQLFAFSCSTINNRRGLKLKLFEAYIRARQLGGDEARVALVCCSDDPEGLEHEIRRDIDPEGRIRVFGRQHLADLATHLEEWMRSQSGEER